MSLRKMGFAEMAASILDRLRKETGYVCYDAVPEDALSPFIFVEIIGKRDSSSKTMFKETFQVNIHLLAEQNNSRLQMYRMIQNTEEALTDILDLPDTITMIMQTETGVNSVMLEETGEWHAVLGYEFMISYGLKIK